MKLMHHMAKKIEWAKNPGKSDMRGIDAPRRKRKQYEEIASLITQAQRIKKRCPTAFKIDEILKELRSLYFLVRDQKGVEASIANEAKLDVLRGKIRHLLRDIEETCNA